MDEQQRRVWQRMLAEVEAYQRGDLPLADLVRNLPGHLQAVDVRDAAFVDGFWDVFPDIEAEHELRTEVWVPPNLASDEHLRLSVERFRTWATQVLATASDTRE